MKMEMEIGMEPK